MLKARRSAPIPLVFYPDYRAMNPYQTQLYAALRPFAAAKSGSAADALQLLDNNAERPVLFHLHWEHQVLIDARQTVESFLDGLAAFRDAGGKIIWTLHNLSPHEKYPEQDLADLIGGLTGLADVIHLHSLEAFVAARQDRTLPATKIRVIPHGNYRGSYPVVSRDSARAALGIENAGMVLLLPGRIAQYKNPQGVVAAFQRIAGPDDRLIVAGHFVDGLQLDTNSDIRILLKEGFASAEDLAAFHAAADLIVLPYVRSLTSGSAILAATLGRGVLGPSCPGLRDVVSSGATGVLYDPAGEDALADAMARAMSEGPDTWRARGRAAAKAVEARDADIISGAWRDLITGIICGAADQRTGATE
ncbi:glycosyltransferase [Marimonas sp. MJW-29]|uniref:Glycosyltransferase n=1 Tax=Sulfitobacter sediminis TaxID=3234186 RepID=A0ABV3RMN7_9RHOB